MSRILNGIDLTLDRPIQLNRNAKPRAMLNGLSGRATEQIWNGYEFAPPELNSVLYLPGYPGSGSTIFDYSGNTNHGAITGATWMRLPSGLWGLSFDGTSNKVTPGITSGTISVLTFKAWVSVAANFTTNYRKIVNTAADGFTIYTDITTGDWVLVPPGGIASGPIVGPYYCVVAVMGASTRKLFINNVQVYSQGTGGVSLENPVFQIGSNDTGNGQFWKGTIALVSIRNVAVSDGKRSQEFEQERRLFGV